MSTDHETRLTQANRRLQEQLAEKNAEVERLRSAGAPLLPDEGCAHCKHPLFAGIKCKNCGRVVEHGDDVLPDEVAVMVKRLRYMRGTGTDGVTEREAADLLERLARENAELRAEAYPHGLTVAYMQGSADTKERMRSQIAALEKDAGRGRHLIKYATWHRNDDRDYMAITVAKGSDLSCSATREAAIDAAIAQQKEGA